MQRDRNAARTILTAERIGRGKGVGVGGRREGVGLRMKVGGRVVVVADIESEDGKEVEKEGCAFKPFERGRGVNGERGGGCLDRAGLVEERAVMITGHAM